MNLKLSLLIFSFFISISTYSQFITLPKQEDAQNLIQRKLIVAYMPVSADSLKQLRKFPEEQEAYRGRVKDANKRLKASIERYWSLHSEITFMESAEIETFLESKDASEFAVLRAEFGTDMRPDPSVRNIIGGFQINLYFAEKKKASFRSMTMPFYINDFMYDFMLSNNQKYLKATAEGLDYKDESLWEYERNMEKLGKNTLLIPESAIDMDQDEAKELYGLPLDFVSNEAFTNTTQERKSGVLVPVVIFHMKKNIWMYAITDPSNMEIVSLSPVNSGINFRIIVTKPGQNPNLGFPVEVMELVNIREANGFGKKQFKAIPINWALSLIIN